MNKEEINNRIALLYSSLQFCSEHTKTFTVGERICINQERFQWIAILSNPEAIPRPVPNLIEVKIKEVVRQITISNFKPSNKDPFYFEIEII
jgi:hypothetical protein